MFHKKKTLEFYFYNVIKLIKVLIYFGHSLLALRFLIEDIMHRPLPIVQMRVNGFSWYQPSTDFRNSTISTNVNVTRRNENNMGASNIHFIPTMPNEPRPTLLPLFPEQPLSLSSPTGGTGYGDTNGFQMQGSIERTPINTNDEDELDLELRLGLS